MYLEFNKRLIPALLFFIFIATVIFFADKANYNFAFRWVGSVPNGDKYAHALLYGTLALLLNYGLGFRVFKFLNIYLQVGSIAVLTFAGLEELSQYYIPSRTCDIYDFLADILGVVLFTIIGKYILKKRS